MGHPANQFFLTGTQRRGTGGTLKRIEPILRPGPPVRDTSMDGWALAGGKEYNRHMLERSRTSRRLLWAVFLLALAATGFAYGQDTAKRGRKYKMPPPTSHVEITVLRATTGKPVDGAAVIFHPLVDGRDNGNMELKTNEEGKAKLDLLVTGSSVRLQIIADGFQTYGEDFKVDKENMAIEVKLKRPTAQYSIYKKSEGAAATTEKPADAPKDATPDASKDAEAKDASADAPKSDAKPQDAPPQPK